MRGWRAWVVAGLLVWIALVTWWALTPVSDTIPTGAVKNRDGAVVETAVTVDCDSPLSGNTKATEPLPDLAAPRAYSRPPCEEPHENDRLIFAIDVLIVITVLVVLVKTWKPPDPSVPLDEVAAST